MELFTRLEKKEKKILIIPFQNSKNVRLHLVFFMKKSFDKLSEARSQNPNRSLIAHLNINSSKNNFEILKETIANKIDIPSISKPNLDFFPLNQFVIDGFTTPYRLDRNQRHTFLKSLTEVKVR